MTKSYCVRNDSKTMQFEINNPYNAEHLEGETYKVLGEDGRWIYSPLNGHYLTFVLVD